MTSITTLFVKVTPQAKENSLVETGPGQYRVKVTTPPSDGKANQAVIKLLSKTLHLAKSRFTIVRGESNRNKVIEVISD